jgi:hypothetical protein
MLGDVAIIIMIGPGRNICCWANQGELITVTSSPWANTVKGPDRPKNELLKWGRFQDRMTETERNMTELYWSVGIRPNLILG